MVSYLSLGSLYKAKEIYNSHWVVDDQYTKSNGRMTIEREIKFAKREGNKTKTNFWQDVLQQFESL